MAVSCSVFCCLCVETKFHVLEGDHLFSHWLNADRTLTQSNRHLIFLDGSNRIQLIGKLVIPTGISLAHANTSWRNTADLTTNMKISAGLMHFCHKSSAKKNIGLVLLSFL